MQWVIWTTELKENVLQQDKVNSPCTKLSSPSITIT